MIPSTRRAIGLLNVVLVVSLVLPPSLAFAASPTLLPNDSRAQPTPSARVDSVWDRPVKTVARAGGAVADSSVFPDARHVSAEEPIAGSPSVPTPLYLPLRLKPLKQGTADYHITLYASRPRVAADSMDAIWIGAVALGENLRPLPDGTPVAWTSDLGRVTPQSSVVEKGVALSQFVGGEVAGAATIGVRIGEWQGTLRVSVLTEKL